MPISMQLRNLLQKRARKSITGVFKSSVNVVASHILFTWMLFDVFDIPLRLMAAMITAIFSIIPLVSPWMVGLLGFFHLLLVQGKYVEGFTLLIMHWYLSGMALTSIYDKQIAPGQGHGYFLSLSVFFGYTAFGLVGILYGPLLMCTCLICYETIKSNGEDDVTPLTSPMKPRGAPVDEQ
jgi:predicted PurR-regulated permease PerM